MQQEEERIRRNYDQMAIQNNNRQERETNNTYELKAFNNWVKAVLIQTHTKRMCKLIERELDLKTSTDTKLLHVLDIGCGRGQDIPKWRLARVQYMVAIDFSEECVRTYEERWRASHEPYHLLTLRKDFTSKDLYYDIEHSYYDMVSAQLCFHYMFGTEKGLQQGLMTILSNLLVEGVFIATIPDSYTIIKKIEQKGVYQQDGSRVYGNRYFSIRFASSSFTSPYGNIYGFYLENAVGKKHEDGTIEYTNEWLIDLDNLRALLQQHGVEIEETLNFLEYYKRNREEYKDLFAKFKLVFGPGERMDPELWEIAHLYRVLVCRKKSKGMNISDFNLKARQDSIAMREVPRSKGSDNRNARSHFRNEPDRRGFSHDHARSRDSKHTSRPRK